MKEHDLKDLWRGPADGRHIEFNHDLLLNELAKTMKTIDRKIKNRDRREIVASIIGIIGHSMLAYAIPFIWSKIACWLLVVWFAYVIYRLRSTRRQGAPDLSLPLAEQLEKRKTYLELQAEMLRSVFWWYVLPPFLIMVVFFAGMGDLSTWDSVLAELLPGSIRAKVMSLVLVGVLYGYITRMNIRAARTVYPPLIREVENLQENLQQRE